MLKKVTEMAKAKLPIEQAEAHCDGPCGVYDPASARIAAEAVRSMTKKLLAFRKKYMTGQSVELINTIR